MRLQTYKNFYANYIFKNLPGHGNEVSLVHYKKKDLWQVVSITNWKVKVESFFIDSTEAKNCFRTTVNNFKG